MDEQLNKLQIFCANLQIKIGASKVVQGGIQYPLEKNGDTVFLTLYNRGTCFVRGTQSELLTLLKAWCDTTFLSGMLHPEFAASWREWNTNADFLQDYHQKFGIPNEDVATEEYKLNREITFHDYMFNTNRHISITKQSVDFVVKNWLTRFCFMNISINHFIDITFQYIENNKPIDYDGSNIPFSLAAEAVGVAYAGLCLNKQYLCGHCPFNNGDEFDCLMELIDIMYVYSNQAKIISYNKTNLNKILNRKYNEISWIDIKPSTPIEDKMKNALYDAGILTMPQYQAMAPVRRYKVDYMIPTPNGGMLAIECDGLQYHATRSAYISDRRRDNLFLQNGITPVRFSSIDINEDIEGCIKTIESLFKSYQIGKQVYHRNGRFGYFDLTT